MRAVLSRVSTARVLVDGKEISAIDCRDTGGVLALVGVGVSDSAESGREMARKIAELRILEHEKSVIDVSAPVMLVSQFTLMGRTKKGRRPSWSDAAAADIAAPIIRQIAEDLRGRNILVAEGQFGANMQVESVNSGPFTVIVET